MKKSSKLPIQAAPVARNITGASMSSDKGVDPSWGWTLPFITTAAQALLD